MNDSEIESGGHDLITIIGSSMTDISEQFRIQGLAERQFSIVHKIARHRFIRADGENARDMFDGEPLIAATFQRRPHA